MREERSAAREEWCGGNQRSGSDERSDAMRSSVDERRSSVDETREELPGAAVEKPIGIEERCGVEERWRARRRR